jgi:aromatic ring-cleaving dioxygenase
MNEQLFLKLDQYFNTGMTPFQMRNFVVNDFQTAYRKIRQSIVEMKARVENKYSMELDMEELAVKIEQCIDLISMLTDPHAIKLQDIQKRRYEYQLKQKKSVHTQVSFELETFGNMLKQLVDSQGGIDKMVENLQSDDFHEKEEALYWIEKMSSSAYSDFINYGTISKGVIDTIRLLPKEDQTIVMQKALAMQYDTIAELTVFKDRLLVSRD